MALLHPFRAVRPVPEAASRVASVPYDVVNRSEAAALAAGHPLSFLHVTRSEIDLPADTDPYAEDVYRVAIDNFRKIRRLAPMVVEEEPALYFYRLRAGSREQIGLAGCFSVDEYERGVIKKHERTRRDKEDDRTRHIVALHAQTGLVFLTYRASQDIDAVADRVRVRPPLIDFEAPDAVRHTIWRVDAAQEQRALVKAFDALPSLYIADGHHRAASAARARDRMREAARGVAAELASHRGIAEYDTFVAVAFPHDQVQILPYNRVVRDLGRLGADAFLERVRARLPVRDGGPEPARRGEASMYLAGRWYTLELGEEQPAAGDRIGQLDVSRLQDRILEPVLEIADVRTDKRIDFVGGIRGAAELQRLVDAGQAAVAFSLFPVSVDDLLAVADAGGIMPPKSTWFEPKVRDGLLVHVI